MLKPSETNSSKPGLRRTLTLPWLVFYGVGVTVGAGIFALIGEIVAIAGDAAPASFLLAGAIATITGLSYALLVRVMPYAGGEAVFVTRGLNPMLGRAVGVGVAATGIISSAAIAKAFAGYAGTLIGLPEVVLIGLIIAVLAGVAWYGVRESVVFAAVITVLELGTLCVVVAYGLPYVADAPPIDALFGFADSSVGFAPIVTGGIIAFFAFVGFEDIENMAEETRDVRRTAPLAIIWTLAITVIVYVLMALVAVSAPGRDTLVASPAPMATLFASVTGFDPAPVAGLAALAMVNGILVQILMSARVLYGMANEGLLPAWFGHVHPQRRTPSRATIAVALAILVLALTVPLVDLARITSLVVLAVFALVNLALYRLGGRLDDPLLRRWRALGLIGAALCVAILSFQAMSTSGFTHAAMN